MTLMMLDVSFIPTPLFLIDSSYFIVAKSKAVILVFQLLIMKTGIKSSSQTNKEKQQLKRS
jgi:hypothetical protein